jgi:hypothetical protein
LELIYGTRPRPALVPNFLTTRVLGVSAVINRIRDALGSLTGSLLGILVIGAIAAAPALVLLWIGVALEIDWAIAAQVRVVILVSDAFTTAHEFLPAWAWFIMFTLAWLAFLDVHVRALVREEVSKYLKGTDKKEMP